MDAPFTVLPTLPPFRLRVVPTTLTFKKPAGTSRGVYLTRRLWRVVLSSASPPSTSRDWASVLRSTTSVRTMMTPMSNVFAPSAKTLNEADSPQTCPHIVIAHPRRWDWRQRFSPRQPHYVETICTFSRPLSPPERTAFPSTDLFGWGRRKRCCKEWKNNWNKGFTV